LVAEGVIAGGRLSDCFGAAGEKMGCRDTERFTVSCSDSTVDRIRGGVDGGTRREMKPHDEAFERSFRKTSNTEGRVHVRIQCSEPTYFSSNRTLFEGTISNISAGGTFIRTRGRFTLDQEVIVAGTFEDGGPEEKRYGKVVRVEDNGIAVAFITKDFLRRP
jgi:hypothetical protein